MGDFLLDIGQKSTLGKMLASLGIPVPHKLKRMKDTWPELILKNKKIIVGGSGRALPKIAETLCSSGATVTATSDCIDDFREPAEAYSRPVKQFDWEKVEHGIDGIVFDATNTARPQDLDKLYALYHSTVKKINSCARLLIIGGYGEFHTPAQAATQSALLGFTKSVAKEIGRKGATANALFVEKGAENRLWGPIRFLLSEPSAYICGQPFYVSGLVKPPASFPVFKFLEGKVALVTGAARGIGKATAQVLAREGASVVCLDRPQDDEPLAAVASSIKGLPLPLDITDAEAGAKIDAFCKKHFNRLDVVVHNAGITRDKTLGNMSEERWQQVMEVNLQAVLSVTEQLLDKGSCLRDDARFVCLSSIAGIAGNFGQTNYAASKSGIIGFVRDLAPRVAQRGITINAVAPGFIETRLTAAIPFMTREVGRRLCNLSQSGLPEDVAQAITFFCSPQSYGISGTVNRVCGGNLLGA